MDDIRKLAEEAVDLIAPLLGNTTGSWTAHACLPGGDLYGSVPQNRAVIEYDGYVQQMQSQYHWLPAATIARYVRAYGTHIHILLDGCIELADMGEEICAGLYEAELIYLMDFEWASCGADILWRRSKLGLHLPADAAQKIDQWMARRIIKK